MKTLCVLPFSHLATHPTGLVSPCCVANFENGGCFSRSNNKVLNLSSSSIDDIMNSDSFTEIRRKMLNDEKPIECMGCYKDEENGIKSKRQRENRRFTVEEYFLQKEKFPLKFVELRLGNVCNIKCLTCNPMSSSKWTEDVKKLPKLQKIDHYNYIDYTSKWFRNKEWYEQLLNHCDFLEEIYINGGEPTLIKEHFYLLEKLIEMDKAKDISLLYNINVTLLPKNFLELLRQFKHVKIQLSIDDIGERNYYIRYPSDWATVLTNMSTIRQENFDVSITQTLSILNVCNIGNFFDFFNDIPIEVNMVYSPNFLHVSNLHEKLRPLALSQIDKITDIPTKHKILYELNKPMLSTTEQGLNFILMMDSVRNLDVETYLLEYKDVL
jgi:MoaA/NifB/PqqE/SkfB family radical SAM enzyme